MKAFGEEQVAQRRYGTTSEYVRELIRHNRNQQQLRSLLLAGAESEPQPLPMTPTSTIAFKAATVGA